MTFESRFRWVARVLIAVVATVYCGLPELVQAQNAQQQPAAQTQPVPQTNTEQQPATDTAQQPAQQNAPAGIVDPSQGPLTPIPQTQTNTNELPNAPSSTPAQGQNAATQQPPPAAQQPVGAAAAQVGPTAGGAASKPAGNAIAPAKQRQTRSFLIKLGAVAAAGVALGTVIALSRGTSGNPPGAR